MAYCNNCGKEFISWNNAKLCCECEERRAEIQKEKQRKYTRDRLRRLNLTSVSVYKDDSKKLASIAREKKTNIAEVIKEMLK